MKVNFIPQGTLVEMIRSKGCGLGGVLTPTGVGTEMAENKQILTIEGKDYILEKPLSAEVALIKGNKVDPFGNIMYHAAARNFNTVMAMAGNKVICEADEIIKIGEFNKECIHTPGIFVDYIVKKESFK
jgi:acetate CoA/acetoacetate CoA-transferase alpha subunit